MLQLMADRGVQVNRLGRIGADQMDTIEILAQTKEIAIVIAVFAAFCATHQSGVLHVEMLYK